MREAAKDLLGDDDVVRDQRGGRRVADLVAESVSHAGDLSRLGGVLHADGGKLDPTHGSRAPPDQLARESPVARAEFEHRRAGDTRLGQGVKEDFVEVPRARDRTRAGVAAGTALAVEEIGDRLGAHRPSVPRATSSTQSGHGTPPAWVAEQPAVAHDDAAANDGGDCRSPRWA